MIEEKPIEKPDKIGQEQIHDLLFEEKTGWQAIIYDLINSEQLDPWDINLVLLTNRFLERIKELEEANFFVSSKVLLAASLLLRLKSEILLNEDLRSLDEILFNKEEGKKYEQQRIEMDEDVPDLIPRTPLPRFRKVTLPDLLEALGKAMRTETRRIEKSILIRRQEFETAIALPKSTVSLENKIKEIYGKIRDVFTKREEKISFAELIEGIDQKNEKVLSFVSLLHLDTQQKVWLEQEGHFDHIWILLKELYLEKNKEALDKLKMEIDALESDHQELSTEEKWEDPEED